MSVGSDKFPSSLSPKWSEGWSTISWIIFSLSTLKVCIPSNVCMCMYTCTHVCVYGGRYSTHTCIYCVCAAVKKMESGFVLGYIQAMDGEKDPRNLIIAFNSVHRIILHLPFGEPAIREALVSKNSPCLGTSFTQCLLPSDVLQMYLQRTSLK